MLFAKVSFADGHMQVAGVIVLKFGFTSSEFFNRFADVSGYSAGFRVRH